MPAVGPSLAPFIQEYMKQHESVKPNYLGGLFQNSLGKLCQDGMTTTGQMDAAALIMWVRGIRARQAIKVETHRAV